MKLPICYSSLSIKQKIAVRNEYIRLQDGKCHHCGKSLDDDPSEEVAMKPVNKKRFPQNFFKWPIHLHHRHDTGMTIGAVHCYCNAVLWQYYGE